MKLSPRLQTAYDLCRSHVRVLDVGTDHAYLPIALLTDGVVDEAMASDVVPGPVARAREHIASVGLSERIPVRMANGLDGWETAKPDDIFILGMGGELIASIIEGAPWVKNPAVHLILQPMTKASVLRDYLTSNGFEIKTERLAREEGRIYQVLLAVYTGVVTVLNPAEALCGEKSKHTDPALYRELVLHELCVLEKKKAGLDLSQGTNAEEKQAVASLVTALKEITL